jgi:hypothetical protein
MIYYMCHSDMDAHHCVCTGVSSGFSYQRMTYYKHHSDMAAHRVCVHIPGKEMITNITQILRERIMILKTNY